MKPAAPTERLEAQLLCGPDARRGQMFGHPAYYVNGKMFACAYGGVIGLKLPEALAADLIARGRAEPFQPYGKRKMREWVQLPCDEASLHEHRDALQASYDFVRNSQRR
jgi:TfoX/Sxy family transcriptional regulator of competence genes